MPTLGKMHHFSVGLLGLFPYPQPKTGTTFGRSLPEHSIICRAYPLCPPPPPPIPHVFGGHSPSPATAVQPGRFADGRDANMPPSSRIPSK